MRGSLHSRPVRVCVAILQCAQRDLEIMTDGCADNERLRLDVRRLEADLLAGTVALGSFISGSLSTARVLVRSVAD